LKNFAVPETLCELSVVELLDEGTMREIHGAISNLQTSLVMLGTLTFTVAECLKWREPTYNKQWSAFQQKASYGFSKLRQSIHRQI
jgi:hypothetical protein